MKKGVSIANPIPLFPGELFVAMSTPSPRPLNGSSYFARHIFSLIVLWGVLVAMLRMLTTSNILFGVVLAVVLFSWIWVKSNFILFLFAAIFSSVWLGTVVDLSLPLVMLFIGTLFFPPGYSFEHTKNLIFYEYAGRLCLTLFVGFAHLAFWLLFFWILSFVWNL